MTREMDNLLKQISTSQKFVLASGSLLAVLAGIDLYGWLFRIAWLKNPLPWLPTMKANTSAAMLLCGVSLVLLSLEIVFKGCRRITLILGILVLSLGALTLTEYFSGLDLKIDQALATDTVSRAATSNPGRPSPSTSLVLSFAGLSILIASLPNNGLKRQQFISALGAISVVLGAMALSANLTEATLRIHWWNYAGVAIQTATSFLLLGFGLLALVHSRVGLSWWLDSKTTAGILVGVACLIAVTVISNNFTYRLQQDESRVGHSEEILKEIAAIDGELASLESVQRGYLITGDEKLLAPRAQVEASVQEHFIKVRDLTAKNSDEQGRLATLQLLIAQRNAWSDLTIDARRSQGFPAAQQAVSSGTGTSLTANIQDELAMIRSAEYSLLDQQQKQSRVTTTVTFLLLPLGLFVSLTIIALALAFLNAGVREEAEARKSLHIVNDHLRATEERFRTLISGVKDYAIFLLDPTGHVTTWSSGAQSIKGWKAEEIIGQHISKFYSPAEVESKKPQSELRVAEAEGRFEEEGWRVRKDGSRFWAHVLISAIRDDTGTLTGFAKVTRDLTESRRKEQAIKDEEERLAAVIGSAMDAIITVDEDQKITLFNPAAERIFLCTASQAIGLSLDRFIPGWFDTTRWGHFQKFIQTSAARKEIPEVGSLYGLRMSGKEFPIEASISQVQIGGDRVFSVILRDVTERKQAEEKLRRQASLLDLAPVLVRDMQDRIKYWSSGVERIYGYSREEALGKISHDLLKTEFPGPMAQIEKHLKDSGGWEGELIHRAKDGSRVVVASQWVLYRDPNGNPVRILEVNADISARKKAEQLQLRSQKLEGLGTLAGGIAHDFNNILLAINGNAKIAIEDLAENHPARESLTEITKAGARAADLVRRILAFSRPQEFKRETLRLQSVVEEAMKLLRASLPATIEFRTQFSEGVPAVVADATQIHQIVINLATNAAHAIGTKAGCIEFRTNSIRLDENSPELVPELQPNTYVCLHITDNGSGMDRATLDQIFDPFFTTKKIGEGTGLGLSVVHGIMAKHGGAVRVYSELGKGTIFHLYFPASSAPVVTKQEPVHKNERGHNEHILYVDDEEGLVFLGKRLLERLGYVVTGHTDALQALEEFRAHPHTFQAVVTDMAMPGMSGLEFARELLATRPDIPIVMTSGYVRPEDQEKALRMGLRDLLLKPHNADQLARTLDRVLHSDTTESKPVTS
jgi:PAS domain S-box-containing protein